jgi:cytochrome P450 / NADPH-cytochrome P450 reductase
MINGKDPKTGKGLPDSNIQGNMLTFLIAGHETTSGLLSFMTYYLLKNPETMRKLRAEVDEVLQGRPLQVSELSKLPYLIGKCFSQSLSWLSLIVSNLAVMRETLRIHPTATARSCAPSNDVILGGKYAVKAGTIILVNTFDVHRDPLVWGDDVGFIVLFAQEICQ